MENLIIENFNGREKVELTTEMAISRIEHTSGRSPLDYTGHVIDLEGCYSQNKVRLACTVNEEIEKFKTFKVTVIIEPID